VGTDAPSLKPRTSRIILYFVAIFAAVAAPTIVPWMFILLGPPPYELNREALAAWSQRTAPGRGGTAVSTQQFSSAAAAQKARSEAESSVPADRTSRGPGTFRYRRSDTHARGLILRVDDVVVRIEGNDAAEVERTVADLPFLRPNPRSPDRWLNQLFEQHLVGLLVGFAIYVVLVAIAMFKGGAWAARISPAPTSTPVSLDEMRRRLLAVKELDVPLLVREDKRGELIAEWKLADARWTGLLEKGGLSIAHQVRLRLDGGRHLARAIDVSRKISWSAGVAGIAFSFSFFRGITFGGIDSGAAYGLLFKDGAWTVDHAYRYSYDLYELKAPLIAAIVAGGWTYQPVVFFHPLLG
jgi:hypothetical protein